MRAFLLVVVVLFCGFSFAESNPPSPTKSVATKNKEDDAASKNTTSKNNEAYSYTSSAISNQPITINGKQPHNENTNTSIYPSFSNNSVEDSITDWIIAIATIVIGIFTIGLFLEDKEKGRKELRAYLGIGGGEVFVLPNGIIRGVVEIKNFGQTPAHKVRPAITGELRNPGDIRHFIEPIVMQHSQPIAPTMHWTFGHEFIGMTESDLQDVLADKKLIYIWGYVSYEDIYGKQQTLRFRFRNVVKVIVQTESGTAIQKWKYYPEDNGNEAT